MCSRLSLLAAALGVLLLGSGFKPFPVVKNVCPLCKGKPSFDTVVLTTGAKIRCDVIAQNSDYYVLERFGVLRMVRKTDVSSVEWKSNTPPKLATGDQVLLHSGLALHGTIYTVQKGRFIEIRSGKHMHTVWVSQIQAAYQGGKALTFKASPTQ